MRLFEELRTRRSDPWCPSYRFYVPGLENGRYEMELLDREEIAFQKGMDAALREELYGAGKA